MLGYRLIVHSRWDELILSTRERVSKTSQRLSEVHYLYGSKVVQFNESTKYWRGNHNVEFVFSESCFQGCFFCQANSIFEISKNNHGTSLVRGTSICQQSSIFTDRDAHTLKLKPRAFENTFHICRCDKDLDCLLLFFLQGLMLVIQGLKP